MDLNWEYPGYSFGSGYGDVKKIEKDYHGLVELMKGLRKKLGKDKIITMAYYPDGRQEQLLLEKQAPLYIDLFHMMTYDQSKGHHSPFELATKSVEQALKIGLPADKLTLGLPFYGRHSRTGDWTTYEDLVQKYKLTDDMDSVQDSTGIIYFNGIKSIKKKTRFAIEQGIGGVMIWEVGQDCRLQAVERSGRSHQVTCPNGSGSSLLVALKEAIGNNYSIGTKSKINQNSLSQKSSEL